MQTIRHPDGTLGTYTVTNPATWAALQSIKPARKPRAKVCKRTYPKWSTSDSVKDYVRAYWRLNFVNGADALAFFQPLPDTPATWAPDTVEIETVEV